MHNSNLVAIAQYFWRIRTSLLYGNQQKFNIEAVNDYPPIRFEIRFERKFPIRTSLRWKEAQLLRAKASVLLRPHGNKA